MYPVDRSILSPYERHRETGREHDPGCSMGKSSACVVGVVLLDWAIRTEDPIGPKAEAGGRRQSRRDGRLDRGASCRWIRKTSCLWSFLEETGQQTAIQVSWVDNGVPHPHIRFAVGGSRMNCRTCPRAQSAYLATDTWSHTLPPNPGTGFPGIQVSSHTSIRQSSKDNADSGWEVAESWPRT